LSPGKVLREIYTLFWEQTFTMNNKHTNFQEEQCYKSKQNLFINSTVWYLYLRKYFNQSFFEEVSEHRDEENTWDDVVEERHKYDYWLLEIACIYRRLSSLPRLNQRQTQCMLNILEFAEFDETLNYYINEADEASFEELRIYDPSFRIDENAILQFANDTWKYLQ
jgi:hypothetical protein